MADNVDAGADGSMQGRGNPPADRMFLPPGAIYPYLLPEGDVEEPFESISWFAIRESGESRRYGPLNEEELKTFLRHKLDRRIVCSRDVIQRYTEDVAGLSVQLTNLRNRINQIRATEKERTEYIKSRIREFEKDPLTLSLTALSEGKSMPVYIRHQLNLSNAAREAFRHIGSQTSYPLREIQLINFIHTGMYDNQIERNELIKQLKDLRLRINDNLDIEKHKVKLPYKRVVKALNDILAEMMTLSVSNMSLSP